MLRRLIPLVALAALSCTPAGSTATKPTVAPVSDTSISDATLAADGAPGPACHFDGDCLASSNPCLAARCSQGTCQVVAIDGVPCSDGNGCTTGDACLGGKCAPGPGTCECTTDGDCKGWEDGDACNGSLACDTKVLPYRCRVVPSSVVHCVSDNDTECLQNRCDPGSGACKTGPVHEGGLCSDGDPCAVKSHCEGGSCKAGDASFCQCQTSADCKDDDNACNGKPYCDVTLFPYLCKVNPASVVSCPTAVTPCTANACDPSDGKCKAVPADADKVCNDGNPCTAGDKCQAGVCKGGSDTCVCGQDSDCDAKEDADLCNGTLFCNLATQKCQVNPKTVISCPSVDDSACAKNTCIAATGLCAMLSAKNGTGCSDDDACTEGDVCLGGKCAGGTDICKCKTDVDCVAKDDGDLCNGSYFCNKPIGACQFNPSSVVQCQTVDDTACLKSVCQPKTGQCQKLPVELAKKQCEGVNCAWVLKKAGDPDLANVFCEEGNACTVGDECAQGVCVPGTYVCSCKSDAECQDEDDGNLCNGTPFCDKSTAPATCKNNPATVISCGSVDDSECLKYQCVAKTGKCQFTPVADFTPCNDGSNCTKNDGCVFGKCQPGTFLCECATSDDCAKKDDGNACNGTWYCDKSADLFLCKYNPASVVFCGKKDDQACLKNTCDAKTGTCGMTPPTKGTPCDDGDACTTATSCQGQDCAAATKVDCDDGNACTQDTCDSLLGCTHAVSACDDGNPCTVDACDKRPVVALKARCPTARLATRTAMAAPSTTSAKVGRARPAPRSCARSRWESAKRQCAARLAPLDSSAARWPSATARLAWPAMPRACSTRCARRASAWPARVKSCSRLNCP